VEYCEGPGRVSVNTRRHEGNHGLNVFDACAGKLISIMLPPLSYHHLFGSKALGNGYKDTQDILFFITAWYGRDWYHLPLCV
jgi:hypothetical protein